jgi:hypothetical protein
VTQLQSLFISSILLPDYQRNDYQSNMPTESDMPNNKITGPMQSQVSHIL